MVPVREGRAKVVTPLTDIQLLHLTATMLGQRKGWGRGEEERRREGKGGREKKKKKTACNDTAKRT